MLEQKLYPINEARQLLGGISRNTIYRMLGRGELASVVLGSRRFVAASEIEKLIATSTRRRIAPAEAATPTHATRR